MRDNITFYAGNDYIGTIFPRSAIIPDFEHILEVLYPFIAVNIMRSLYYILTHFRYY